MYTHWREDRGEKTIPAAVRALPSHGDGIRIRFRSERGVLGFSIQIL
jgi:hypothetical protein